MNRPIKVSGREVVFFDEDITVYKASGKERLCAEGKHLVVVINRHVERIYDLVSAMRFEYHCIAFRDLHHLQHIY